MSDDASAASGSAHDRAESDGAPRRARRAGRRATTPPPPGSDPTPIGEPERHSLTENDDRLRAEKPPHY